jgi:hypothetical protein
VNINLEQVLIMEMEFKRKKKDIYIPLKKIIKETMKSLKSLDLNIPIAQIARMDIAGILHDDSLEDFRKTVLDYLNITNQYRRQYFEFMKKTKSEFDREMGKDGSFAPGLKQYNSIKNQIYEALIKSDANPWIMSYDQYLPTIREHSDKRSKHPRSGKKLFNELQLHFEKDIKEIKNLQKLSIQFSKLFLKDLNLAIKNPELGWQEWLVDDNYSKLKKKAKKHE